MAAGDEGRKDVGAPFHHSVAVLFLFISEEIAIFCTAKSITRIKSVFMLIVCWFVD